MGKVPEPSGQPALVAKVMFLQSGSYVPLDPARAAFGDGEFRQGPEQELGEVRDGGTDFAWGVREGLSWSLLEGEGRRQRPSITKEMT